MKALFKQLLALALPLTLLLTACEKNSEDPKSPKTTIELIKSDAYAIFDKYVVIYEDSRYLIKSPLNNFISELDYTFIHDYPSYLSTLNRIVSDGASRDSLNAKDYFNEDRMKFLLAQFLQSGQCYIKDKNSSTSVPTVVMEIWGGSSAPLSGAGGRKFYINGELFLETTDWIS